MMKKTYPTIIIIILAATIIPLFTPTAVAQEATATIEIQNCNVSCLLTVVILSPTSVSEYQIAIKVSNTINLVPSSTLTTGFMSGSSHLTLEGSSLDEHRWFNLQSQGGTVGRLTIPISNYAGKSIILDKVNLIDDDGNRIDVVIPGDGNVDVGIAAATTVTTTITTTSIATSTSTNIVTSLSTRTSTATVTSTRTMMATSTTVRTATTTTTVTSAQTTITQTVSSTSTAKVTAVQVASTQSTSTITNTQTNTETVEEGSAFGVYTIVFAVIAIILLGLAVLRQQREDLFTKLREKIPF